MAPLRRVLLYYNAPDGVGADTANTQTNGTAYIRGTDSRVHTQTQTNTQRGPTKYGADSPQLCVAANRDRDIPSPAAYPLVSLSVIYTKPLWRPCSRVEHGGCVAE